MVRADDAEVRLLRARLEVAALAGGDLSPADALQAILAACGRALGADAGAIALVRPESDQLVTEAQWGDFGDPGPLPPLRPDHGITGWCIRNRRPVLVEDVRREPRYIPVRPAARAELVAPLLDGETLIGVIDLESDRPGGFGPADVARLEQLAADGARVMGGLWRAAHLRSKARQLESLIAAGRVLVTQLEERELAAAFTRAGRRMFAAAACSLHLHDAARGTLRCVALDGGERADGAPAEVALEDSLLAVAVQRRRPVCVPEIGDLDRSELLDLPAVPARGALLAAPLLREDEVLGVVAILCGGPHRFDDDEKRLGEAFASLGAVALENARLYARVFRSEEILRRNERLTTLGLLAAEIAHEVRNPLTVIKLLHHGGLGLDFPADDPRRTDLRVIHEKLDQLEAIVSRVLGFARAPSELHARWPVADIVADTLALVRLKLAQQKVVVEFSAPPVPLIVEAHKGQLQQVLLNLLLNAAEAMPGGGRIHVALSAESGASGRTLVLDLADTGGGVPEALRDRIFDSFLSGRPDGTGLGLAIAKRILRGHQGDLRLLRTGPDGTTMRVTLPLAP